MRRTSQKVFTAAALALALAIPGTAGAWIFSGDVLIHKVGVARRTLRMDKDDNRSPKVATLSVTGEMTLSGPDAQAAAKSLGTKVDEKTGDLVLKATASYKFPGKCKLAVSTGAEGARQLTAVNKGVAVVDAGEGASLETLDMFANMACPLLDGRGGYEGPMSLVKAAEVKRYTVTLGRLDKTHLAYVLGGTPAQTEKSTLWIAKDIFQPVRFVDRSGPVAKELRMDDYDSTLSTRWHPRRMQFIQGGKVLGSFILETAAPNAALTEADF